MMMKKGNKGITLIEIMLVMAIIAILAASLWGNYFSSLAKGRDSRRKQDLEMVAKALELYYSDMEAYPATLDDWGGPFTNPSTPSVIYMEKLPLDPQSANSPYCYTADTDGKWYKLYANLENDNDGSRLAATVTCDSVDGYDYGIASLNTSP